MATSTAEEYNINASVLKLTSEMEEIAQNLEYTMRHRQAQAWATSIMNSNLTRKEAHMAYHGVIHAKIGYALPVTTFTWFWWISLKE